MESHFWAKAVARGNSRSARKFHLWVLHDDGIYYSVCIYAGEPNSGRRDRPPHNACVPCLEIWRSRQCD